MVQNESIYSANDYVNYTFHISSKGAGQVAGELMGLSNTISTLLGDIAFKTSEMLSHTQTLAIGTGIAVGGMFASATKDAIRFEQQLANVKAIGGESLNTQEIGNAAMEYSNKFGMATASMTEGLEALARAGITTTSVMTTVLEEGVKLSKLEGMDLEDSINDLIATTNLLALDDVNMNDAQYADMVKQMNQHIVSTSESAPINAQNIIQTLQHVGGYASASGIDQEDLFAVIAQLGSRGTKGEMAGTALRAFIAAGQKDTAQRALARIGLNVKDLWNDNGETMLSVSEMKDVLDEALESRGYSKQEKLEFYSDFAGYKQANQIMKINTSEVQQYRESIANAWDLGKKLDTILGTVRGNLDRIWQITQNFMTKVGGKILFIANAILTPVRILLELINKMPFADTAVAAGMIVVGFSGVLKVINNIVPRFSAFFIQLSQSRRDMMDIRNVWRKLPDDISQAKQVIDAMSDPKKMLEIQQDRQLYSKKEIDAAEDQIGRIQFVKANLDDPTLLNLPINERKKYLDKAWDKKDQTYKQNFINTMKVENPEKYADMIKEHFERIIKDSNLSASRASYDITEIMNDEQTALWEINEYVGWIYRMMGGPTLSEHQQNNNSPPPPSSSSNDTESNRQRNARVNEKKIIFKDIGNNILRNKSEYGDYSYKVNPDINMPQFDYNDIEGMRRFEAQVKSEIQRKMDIYANFFEDSSIEAGRNRLKKSLTIAAKTDLGYEFSTGANTSDIKKILETGHIREGSSHILEEQLNTIADILEVETTGNTNADMQRFHRILSNKNNKDELLESILNKTQAQWNNKYYNNGRVGFFPTDALKTASDGATARKIMEKVGVSSIAEVQEHFKNVALDDNLLNECVDIMYQDKELVEKLVNEEIKYMYENLARVQNSILSASRERHSDSTFQNKGEEYVTNLQKARDYVLADFNPNEFERFTSSPNGSIGEFTISQAIDAQNQHLLQDIGYEENIEGFQGYIYPIGGDIARSQRYGNDNFKIRNIKHIPHNKLLGQNVEEVFLDRYGDIGFDFMETFADWVSEVAAFDEGYWETTFNADYADDYWISGFEGGQEKFNELKQELEEIYRAYVDLCAWGAQSLIEATTLYGPMVSYRGGRLYTPENSFGAFDSITSSSLHYGVAKNFWNKNPQQKKILEIFSPEDTHGILAHTDLLNDENKHLWGRERELTFGKDQPYLHLPNPEGFEERLLMLTDDQKNAVKEIMGEGFEFEKNAPFDPFLNAGEPDYGGSFDLFDKKYPNLHKNHKLLNMSKYIDKSVMEQIKQELQLKKKYRLENTGEVNPYDFPILTNAFKVSSPILNKDILTAENMGQKLQDLLQNGTIEVDTRYRSGALGGANSDGVIDINTGSIKYHADNYNNEYGNYGEQLLETVLHEMTHVLMMHQERQDYQINNIPSELGIDNFQTSQFIQGYNTNFVAEYEAQYVSSQVLNRLGIEASQKSQQRMAAFKDLIEREGYGNQIQYELLDNLVDEMLNSISTIGSITKGISTQLDVSADTTLSQINEDMRPILTKIQAFNKDTALYQGPTPGSKKDEIDQILSDMETDMGALWDTGLFDVSTIYTLIAQKYMSYINTRGDYGTDLFLEHVAPNFKNKGENNLNNIIQSLINEYGLKEVEKAITNAKVLNNAPTNNNITDVILSSWEHLKTETERKLPLDMFYEYIAETYGEKAANEAQEWIDEASKNVDGLLTYNNTGLSKSKDLLPDVINKWNDKRKQIDHYEYVHLPDSNVLFPLPVHKEFAENGYTLHTDGKQKGQIDRSLAQKYIHKNSAKDPRSFLGIVDLLDTDFVRNLSKKDQHILRTKIAEGESANFSIQSLMDSDGKLGEGWGALNITTAMDCQGRLEDGSCEFCDACYAFGQAARLPEQAIKQIAKSILFATTSAEDLAKIINEQKIQIIRFNQEGDFRDVDDYLKTVDIANMSPNSRFYGYTKNQEVLDYIEKNGMPSNYQMQNSLDTWETGNYTAASWNEVLDYLEKGYRLCQGACEDCKQCLHNINKVTILRTGGQPLDVGDVSHLTHQGQIAVFQTLRDYEKAGVKVTKTLAEEVIADVTAISKMVRKSNSGFQNKGESTRLPELGDYFPKGYSSDDNRRDDKYIESLGYGGLDQNIRDFIEEVNDTFLFEENELVGKTRKRRRTDDHWGTREVINYGYKDIGSLEGRLLNYGLFYNRKKTKDVKEGDFEEVINLFNRKATKEAFNQGIISANQLKKWHKQLQDSIAVDKYGQVPWNIEDVNQWAREKEEADRRLNKIIEEKRKKNQALMEAQQEIIIATLQVLSLMPAINDFGMPELVESMAYIEFKIQERARIEELEDIAKQTAESYVSFYTQQQKLIEEIQQKQFDNQNQKFIIEENAKKNAESYKQYYKDEARIIEERNEAIWDSFSFIKNFQNVIRGNNVAVDNNKTSKDKEEEIDEDLLKTLRTKYTRNVYEEMNDFEKARYILGKDGKNHTILNKGIDFAEWFTTGAHQKASDAQDAARNMAGEDRTLGKLGAFLSNYEEPIMNFKDTLGSLSEIFPILIPAVSGLSTALTIMGFTVEALTALDTYRAVVLGEEGAAEALNTMAKEGNTAATILNTAITWAQSDSIFAQTAAKIVDIGVNLMDAAATAIKNTVQMLGITGILAIAAAIAVVIAAIEAVKFWENQHAEALKKSQKALEESVAKNNIALSQYEDLKKARENETDVIKKQQAARKEAIALYKLEAARIEKRNAVHDEAKLRGDAVWGEYGLRASLQKMGLGIIAGGDFESQYENYDGTTANIRQIKESTLGNLFASSEQRYVSSIYDSNKMFFAEVEAYKEPLQELYDKESKLIDQYGSVENARASQEFYDAVKEFSKATGINGETAGKMLDWLETENRVDQATTVGQAKIDMIMARADAEVAKVDMEESGLGDMTSVGNAMVYAQWQDMMNTAKTKVWWEILYAYLDTFISILIPWKWGEVSGNLKKVGIRQQELSELNSSGNEILNDMFDAYTEAERRDYETNSGMYDDTPFGQAITADALSYAINEQEDIYRHTGKIFNDSTFLAIQEDYQKDTYGITNEQLKQEKAKKQEEKYNQLQANKKAHTTLEQLQNNGDVAHKDALDIIDAIKGKSGAIMGAGIGFSIGGDDLFSKISEHIGDGFKAYTDRNPDVFDGFKEAYAEDGLEGLASYTKERGKEAFSKVRDFANNISEGGKGSIVNKIKDIIFGKQVEGLTTPGTYMTEGGILPTLKTGLARAKSGLEGLNLSSLTSKAKDIIFGKQVPGLTTPGTYMTEGGILPTLKVGLSRLKTGISNFSPSSAASTLQDIIFGKQVPGLTTPGTYMTEGGIIPTAKGILNHLGDTQYGSILKSAGKASLNEMGTIFNPKTISTGFKEIGLGLKGGGTLLKGAGKLAGPAAAILGGATTFMEEYEEHDPSKKHYNADGSEKKAFQSTGEVVGSTAGSIAGGIGGAVAGAEIGAAAGSIVPGIGTGIGAIVGGVVGGIVGEEGMRAAGDAIGGTIGWATDEVIYPALNKGKDFVSQLSTQVFGSEDNPVNTFINNFSAGAHDLADKAVGAAGAIHSGLGSAWEYVSGAAGNAWNAITGWLNGDNAENNAYANVDTQDVVTNAQTSQSTNTIVIENININTEDDPEKIKTAFMNLMIELEEQITPRQVSRVIGTPPNATTSTNDATNTDINTDPNTTTDPNNPNATTTNNNNNPTV